MLAKEMWDTLSGIDVSKHTEKKGKFTYLSWSWAWRTLMEHYPESSYTFRVEAHEDATVTVYCNLLVADHQPKEEGGGQLSREMWLPVMDNRNAAVQNPDARAISDCKMRCLTKAMAMFGLGHYIYAREDLPGNEMAASDATQYNEQQLSVFMETLNDPENPERFAAFMAMVPAVVQSDLFNSFPKGKKTEYKNLVRDQEKRGHEALKNIMWALREASVKGHEAEAQEITGELTPGVMLYIKQNLDPETAQAIETLTEATA